jgi:hypothetical protein
MAWLPIGSARLESSDPLATMEIDLVYVAVDGSSISCERHTVCRAAKHENGPVPKCGMTLMHRGLYRFVTNITDHARRNLQ